MHFSTVLTARVLSAGFQAISLLLVARLSSPADFGVLTVTISIIAVAVGLSDLGLQTTAVREFARADGESIALAMMREQRFLTAVVAVVATGCFGVLVTMSMLPIWSVAIPLWTWLDKEVNGALGLALAANRSSIQIVALSVSRGGCLAGTAVAYWLTPQYVASGYIASAVLSSGIAAIITYRVVPAYKSIHLRPPKSHLRRALPFWIASASGQVRNLDALLVSVFSGFTQAGLYGVPSRVSGPLRLAATSLSAVALPFASRGDGAELARLKRTMFYVTGSCAVALTAIGFYAEVLITVFVGKQFAPAAQTLQILIVGLVLNIPGSFTSGILQGSGHQASIAKLGLFLAATSLLFVSVGAAAFGANGAALGVTLVYLIQFASVTVMSRRLRRAQT